jgi:putative peptidoglycan lipid II flippase
MISTLLVYGRSPLPRLAVLLAWGSVAGSALQFAIQVPVVLRLAPQLRFKPDRASDHVQSVLRNFVPAFFSRGVVQISAYVDGLLASLLPTGAVTGLANAQLLYTLPVSLFGMSVSAAELPAMSGSTDANAGGAEVIRDRLNAGLRRIAFFVVPSAVAFLALGDVVASTLLQTGRFRYADAVYVWAILAGSAVGLLPSTLGRLYSSAFYAIRDTRTPLRFALIRVSLAAVLGYVFAVHLPRWTGIPSVWGVAGLTAAGGIAGWLELQMLRRTMHRRIGHTGLAVDYITKLWIAALSAAAAAWVLRLALPDMQPALRGLLILSPYGLVFLAVTLALGVPEAWSGLRLLRRS